MEFNVPLQSSFILNLLMNWKTSSKIQNLVSNTFKIAQKINMLKDTLRKFYILKKNVKTTMSKKNIWKQSFQGSPYNRCSWDVFLRNLSGGFISTKAAGCRSIVLVEVGSAIGISQGFWFFFIIFCFVNDSFRELLLVAASIF